MASLGLDLDNQWSYLKTHGDAGWTSFPSYLDCLAPRILDTLRKHQVRCTVFVVGQDAANEKNHAALRSLADGGHEIGNHSFNHEQWLHLYTPREIESDLSAAEEHIFTATGQNTNGFRGPGYSFSTDTLEALARRGYLYDASTFPTYLGPLARTYYFRTSHLNAEEKHKRAQLFGAWSEGNRPLNPYRWQLERGQLLELPVTTFPGIKVPIHASYILYLSAFSTKLALSYAWSSLQACRLAGVAPSLLLHPLDFLDDSDVSGLSFFPAMKVPSQHKLQVVGRILDMMVSLFDVLPLGEFAKIVSKETLPVVAGDRAVRPVAPGLSVRDFGTLPALPALSIPSMTETQE